MATKKTSCAAVFDGFGGIDTRLSHSGAPASLDVCNFRILENGSLKKRCGYRPVCSFDKPIRSVWSGIIEGEYAYLILCEETLYRYFPKTAELTEIGGVMSSEGEACFFFFRDTLYLCADETLYSVSLESGLTAVSGYVPTVAVNWSTGMFGELYEPRNYLSRKAKLSYLCEHNPTSILHTYWEAESIDRLTKNGVLLSPDSYSYDPYYKIIILQGLAEGDSIEVVLTYAYDEKGSKDFFSSTKTLSYGGLADTKIFMYGGRDARKVYVSEPVTDVQLELSKEIDKASLPLYFPYEYEINTGGGNEEINAIARHYDRILIFTENNAYNASNEINGFDSFPLTAINSRAGCASVGGVGTAGNSPVTVGRHTVWEWLSDTDEYDLCNARSISGQIDPLLSDAFYRGATVFTAKKHDELWLHLKGDESTWIYSVKGRHWYRFTGLDADEFIDLDGDIGFISGGDIYLFDEALSFDILADGTEKSICASFSSSLLEHGSEKKKRLSSFCVRADTDGGSLCVLIDGNGISPKSFELSSDSSHSLLSRRLSSGRFYYSSFTLSSLDRARPTIHSAALYVR